MVTEKKEGGTKSTPLKAGYVYFIYMPEKYEGDHLVKIGITKNAVFKRLGQLQTGNPYVLKVYKTMMREDYKVIEHDLHKKYAEQNKLNEWFHITLEEVDKIISEYNNKTNIATHKEKKKQKEEVEEITVDETMDRSRKIYATSKNWLKDKWVDNPEETKNKWCTEKIKKAINKHMSTDDESWKSNDLKALAEFRFFYETYCSAKSPSLDKKLADSIRDAWQKDKEIVESQTSGNGSFKFVYIKTEEKKEEITWSSKLKHVLKWIFHSKK